MIEIALKAPVKGDTELIGVIILLLLKGGEKNG